MTKSEDSKDTCEDNVTPYRRQQVAEIFFQGTGCPQTGKSAVKTSKSAVSRILSFGDRRFRCLHCRLPSLQAGLISYGCRWVRTNLSDTFFRTWFLQCSSCVFSFFARNLLFWAEEARKKVSKQAITLAPEDAEAPAPKPSPATPNDRIGQKTLKRSSRHVHTSPSHQRRTHILRIPMGIPVPSGRISKRTLIT